MMDDLISRQDAIRIVDGIDTWQAGWRDNAIESIKALPSAQPDCTECAEYDHETKSCPKYCDVIRRTVEEAKQERTGRWIPCSERLPEEDHWLGGSGRQFSDNVMVTIVNHSDEDTWVDTTYTIDGEWALELPRHCKITAWCELPEPYREGES